MRRQGKSAEVTLAIAVLHAMAIKGAVFTLAEIAEIAEVSPQAISQVYLKGCRAVKEKLDKCLTS